MTVHGNNAPPQCNEAWLGDAIASDGAGPRYNNERRSEHTLTTSAGLEPRGLMATEAATGAAATPPVVAVLPDDLRHMASTRARGPALGGGALDRSPLPVFTIQC